MTDSKSQIERSCFPAEAAEGNSAKVSRNLFQKLLLALAIGTLAGSASGANKYWVGDSGTTNAPTGGTWQTTTPTVWSDGTVDTANAGWTAGDTAFFGGADGVYGIRVPAALTAANIRFSASGYTLSNNVAATITGTGASESLIVDAGKTNTIGTNVTFAFGGATVRVNAASTPSGTLIIENGGAVQQTVNGNLVVVGSNTVVSVKTGGFFRDTYSSAGSPHLVLGNADGDDVTLNVDGGTVSIARTTASFWVPGQPISPPTVNSLKGTLNVNGGILRNTTAGASSAIVLGMQTNYVGILNLNGGTVTIQAIQGSLTTGLPGTGTSIVNFNGGILKAVNNASNFVDNVTAAYVRNGGAIIDTSAKGITNFQAYLHTTNTLDNATDGGLLGYGAGTLVMYGANTYNGPTVVSNGTFITTTASIGAGAYTVRDGAAFEVQVNTGGTSLTNSSLTLGASGNVTNTFTLGGNASATIPAVKVTGALNLNGTVRVNVNGSLAGPSTNLLISYGSLSGSGSFVAGVVPSVPGFTGLLVNDTVNKQLKLVYLPPSVPVQWATTSGNWDTTTLNWQPLGGGSATNYYELSPVTFDDNAPFAATHTVTLTGNRTPTDITVNSANNYVFTGGFALTSGGVLTKSGNGTLTLGVNSAHNGGTIINAGTVQVGTGGTTGSIGSGDIADNGTLIFNRSDALTVFGAISGSGSLIKNGSGTLSLAATNSYSGPTVINAGKLAILAASTGGGSNIVADGATLEVQSSSATSTLAVSGLTLGTSGQLTNNFALGTGRTASIPLLFSTGDVNLNGTVTVNVSGSGLATGTYILLQYNGSLTGSGSFVAGTMPGLWTLTNDVANKQLKITGTPGVFWDAGNTNNGGTIDAGSGVWDFAATNLVWNTLGMNVAYTDGNNAFFGGADGAYGIKVGATINPPFIIFQNSGYVLSNDTPQSITMSGTSTAVPKLQVAAGKTATIGTNITVNLPNSSYLGNFGDNPGGTLVIENGAVVQITTANTMAVDGAGSVVSVKTGGILRHQGGVSSQLAIGASNTGNPATVSVDGGSVEIIGNNKVINVGNGSGPVAGILTLNAGSVTMPAATTKALTLGVNAGNAGTLNLNGGVLNVAQINKGNGSAFATNNFNGGMVRAVNATFGPLFLSGLDRANVRNGGALFDNGGFGITVDQALEHSSLAGDNAVDGGLKSSGVGALTLGGVNTYTGGTVVSNGTLALGVAGSIASSAGVEVRSNATFDVSAVSFTLGAAQTLKGGGTVNGNVTANGTIAPGDGVGTLTFNNDLNIAGNLTVELDKSQVQTSDYCQVAGVLVNSGTGTVTVTNLGPALATNDTFALFSQPVANGGALTITSGPGSGVVWTNLLAVDGTIKVLSVPNAVASNPTNITFSASGGTLALSWPTDHLGWILQVQTNALSVGLKTNWFDVPGSQSMTATNIGVTAVTPTVFYRLRHP